MRDPLMTNSLTERGLLSGARRTSRSDTITLNKQSSEPTQMVVQVTIPGTPPLRRASDERVRHKLLEAFRVLHGVDDREVLVAHALAVLGGLVVVSESVSSKHASKYAVACEA